MKKKIILLVLGLVTALSMCACGDNGKNGGASNTNLKNIDDEINDQVNISGVFVNGEFFPFSKEEGLTGLANMPTYAQKTYSSGQGLSYKIDNIDLIQTKGTTILEDNFEEKNPGCIIGMFVKDALTDKTKVNLGVICGTNMILYKMNGAIEYGDADSDIGANICTKYLTLSFVDNYKIFGLTKDSSVEEIKNAGYRASSITDVYYNIYSDMPINYENIDSDYERLYNSGLTYEDVSRGKQQDYIDYWNEFAYINSQICGRTTSEGYRVRYLSLINSEAEAWYDELTDPNDFYTTYEDEIKMRLAIASEMYLLETGKIDYFVISQIDTKGSRTPGSMLQGTWLNIDLEARYEDNVLTLYLITNQEDYDKWLRQAGWGE